MQQFRKLPVSRLLNILDLFIFVGLTWWVICHLPPPPPSEWLLNSVCLYVYRILSLPLPKQVGPNFLFLTLLFKYNMDSFVCVCVCKYRESYIIVLWMVYKLVASKQQLGHILPMMPTTWILLEPTRYSFHVKGGIIIDRTIASVGAWKWNFPPF